LEKEEAEGKQKEADKARQEDEQRRQDELAKRKREEDARRRYAEAQARRRQQQQQAAQRAAAEQARVREAWEAAVRLGERKSPPDRDAARVVLEVYAVNAVKEISRTAAILDARPTGFFDIQYFTPNGYNDPNVDANAGVGVRWTFRTRAGFTRTTSGWVGFYHDRRRGRWIRAPAFDRIDGMPYYD